MQRVGILAGLIPRNYEGSTPSIISYIYIYYKRTFNLTVEYRPFKPGMAVQIR